jgi:Holliday junction resolvase RusA-like endonuclease
LLEEPLCLRVTVFCDVPKSKSKKFRALALADNYIPTTKPDLDNVVKLVGDAGNGIVWKDDSHIAEVHARRRYGDAPALHITVERCVG